MMRRPDKTGDTDIHTRQQLLGEEWWTSAFLALMRPGRDTIEFARGRKLAERGQVIIRGIVPGGVEAVVLGAVGGSRRVCLWFSELDDDWDVLLRIFHLRQDLFTRLLAGDYDPELQDLISEAGIHVIPTTVMDLDYRCDCESDHHTCSHIIATYLSLGKFINEDPMTLFLLRGKTREEIIQGVSELSADSLQETTPGPGDADDDGGEEEDGTDLNQYYSTGQELETIAFRLTREPGSEDTILRTLGKSPFRIGKVDLADLIADLYPRAARFVHTYEKNHKSPEIFNQEP